MALIMFFIFLMGLADVYIAGYFGKEIKAAYGLSYQFYFIFLIIGIAYSVGLVSVVSRLFTSKNSKESIGVAVYSSLTVLLIAAFLVQAAAFSAGDVIVSRLSGSRGPVGKYAVIFIRLYCLGILFDYFLINTNGVLRAAGMIRKSLFTMSLVCAVNIACNFLFAFHTPLGYKGIAVSTVFSLLLGSSLNVYFLFKHILKTKFSYSYGVVKSVLKIAWPMGFLNILWQLGTLALFFILGRLPENSVEIMAAFTNGLRIEAAVFLPCFAFNMANAVIVGNLMGKNKDNDAFLAGLANTAMGVLAVCVLTLIVMANAGIIARMISRDSIVAAESIRYMYIAFIFEPVMAWGVILAGGLSGAGDTKAVMLIIALSVWLVRIPLSYILGIVLGFGPVAVWWSMNLSILAQSVFLSKRYFSKRWMYLYREVEGGKCVSAV
jgi:multidrug resistance protein, MATE family